MRTPKIDLDEMRRNPAAFRRNLIVPGAHGPMLFGPNLEEFQRKDFRAIDPSLLALANGETPPIRKFWFGRTKGAGKGSDISCSVLWLMAMSERPQTIIVGAGDAGQADELRKSAQEILRCNDWLAEIVVVEQRKLKNPATGSVCEVIAADALGSHGSRPSCLVLDELTHQGNDAFARTMFSNAAKVPTGLTIVATNAGFCPSWQWDLRCEAERSDAWYFEEYNQPAPWLSKDDVEELRRTSPPSMFARLWKGEWVSPGGDALPADLIDSAVTLPGPLTGPEPGWKYACGLDIGVTHDRTAICVIGKHVGSVEYHRRPVEEMPIIPRIDQVLLDVGEAWEMPTAQVESEYETIVTEGSNRFRVAYVRSWKPRKGARVNFAEIKATLLRLWSQFGLCNVAYDTSQALYLSQELRAEGLNMVEVHPSGKHLQQMASLVLDGFNGAEIDLYPNQELLDDLKGLRIEEKQQYGFRLKAPKASAAGHSDAATAFQLALFGANRIAGLSPYIRHSLVHMPGAA